MGDFIRRLGKKVQGLFDKIFGKKDKKPQSYDTSCWTNITSTDMKLGDGEINCGWVEIPSQPEIQKNFFNIPLTLLPKRIPVKTLLASLAANQQWDYQAVDMSQYEEKGLAHFIVGRTCGMEELMEKYFADQHYTNKDEEQEDRKWLEEMLSEAKDGLFSTYVGRATLLHYEELGIWSFEMEDD